MTSNLAVVPREEPPAPSATELALERTHMADERTMMAWIRTAASLITFGFSIYKFFDYFPEGQVAAHGLIGPRFFALVMIGTGLFALAAVVSEHFWSARVLHHAGRKRGSLATMVAALVAALGILAFISVLLRE